MVLGAIQEMQLFFQKSFTTVAVNCFARLHVVERVEELLPAFRPRGSASTRLRREKNSGRGPAARKLLLDTRAPCSLGITRGALSPGCSVAKWREID
jgi:hypothetical protein